jgi:glucan endo-1,3-beta-D-glucosidase
MPSRLLTLATAVSGAAAAFQGFNYGSTFTDGTPKSQTDFENEFKTAAGLDGTKGGFTSARLYTMVQGGTGSDPISAIPAAIKTKTSLLLGLWASGGQATFNNEISALKKTIDQYCSQLDGLVAGISVGSEDLYRISPIGQAASPDPGASPTQLVNYITEVRNTIKGSCLESAPIGHVDTWTAYVNETNNPVINAIDWIGMDAYPYYENTKPNGLENAAKLFQAAIDNTKSVSGGKPIWIAETGWPVSGPTSGSAVPGVDAAQTFWRAVGCPMFGNTNVWWFTLQDGAPTIPSPAFGVIGSTLTTKPLYDLSCDASQNKPTTTSQSSAQTSETSSQSQDPPASTSAAQDPTTDPAETSAPQTSAPADTTTTQQVGESTNTPAPPQSTLTTATNGNGGGNASTVNSGTSQTAPSSTVGTGGQPVSTVPPQAAGNKLNALAGVAVGAVIAVAVL